MIPWFLLYPAIGAAIGGGGAKLAGKDWKKGMALGAGVGLGAGALPALAGAGAGGNAGWASLMGKGAAGTHAAESAAMYQMASPTGKAAMIKAGFNPVTGKVAAAGAGGAGKAGLATAAKQAAIGTALSGTVSAAMPKYGSTQLLMNPGPMQMQDPMDQLRQLMSKKGLM